MSGGSDNDTQDKSFEASETKIKKSREKGDIPQAAELNVLVSYIGFVIVVAMLGGVICKRALAGLSIYLAKPDDVGALFLGGNGGAARSHLLPDTLISIAPLFLVLAVSVLASLIVQRGIVFAPSKIRPKLSRISPISNFKQKYGRDGLVEFLKRLVKLVLIVIITGLFFLRFGAKLPGYSAIDAYAFMPELQNITVQLCVLMIIGVGMIVLIDLPYSRFTHLQKLRMTLREVRDEMKDAEGDAQMKSERRARAQAIANSSMMKDVKTADVVVINPTHFAVALKWSREKGSAPICVAKGVDEVALSMRRIARLHDVPIHSNPPCARSLFAAVDIGQEIQDQHYAAVAASIHFADTIRRKRKVS